MCKYYLKYNSINPIDWDIDKDGVQFEVYDFNDEFKETGPLMRNIEHLLTTNGCIFSCNVYCLPMTMDSSFFSIVTIKKEELLTFIRFLIEKKQQLDIEINEFLTRTDLENFINKLPKNYN